MGRRKLCPLASHSLQSKVHQGCGRNAKQHSGDAQNERLEISAELNQEKEFQKGEYHTFRIKFSIKDYSFYVVLISYN